MMRSEQHADPLEVEDGAPVVEGAVVGVVGAGGGAGVDGLPGDGVVGTAESAPMYSPMPLREHLAYIAAAGDSFTWGEFVGPWHPIA